MGGFIHTACPILSYTPASADAAIVPDTAKVYATHSSMYLTSLAGSTRDTRTDFRPRLDWLSGGVGGASDGLDDRSIEARLGMG